MHLEGVNQTTIRDDTELIAEYLDKFAQLQELALSQEESNEFLDSLIKDFPSN